MGDWLGVGFGWPRTRRSHDRLDTHSARFLLHGLIAIKMGVAILWMGLSWGLAVAFGLGGPISMTEIVPSVTAEAFPLSYPFWVVQSVFVLLAGFFAAWRF